MQEADLARQPRARCFVDQTQAALACALEFCLDVVGLEADVVQAPSPSLQEAPDPALGIDRFEEFDLTVAATEQRGSHALIDDGRFLLEGKAQRVAPEEVRGVEIGDHDPDMMNSLQHGAVLYRAMDASSQGSGPGTVRDAETLSQPELQALDPDRTVAVCAVSALEVHGPHLPIGSDYHQAIWMADETARRFLERNPEWTAVRYPPLPIGTDELPLPGSVNTPPRVVYEVVRAFGEQLARAGFRYVMLTNAHGGPRHAAALEAACRVVSRRAGISMFTPSIRALYQLTTGLAFDRVEAFIGRSLGEQERAALVSGEHAGGWETSWYLAKFPEMVAPEFKSLPADEPPEFRLITRLGAWIAAGAERLGRPGSAEQIRTVSRSLAGGIGWTLNSRFGYGRAGRRVSYHGAPAVASPEIGNAYAEISVEMCLEDLEAVTSGQLDALEVRSIASDPLLIQPHFPRLCAALLVAIALLVAFVAWAF